jgi:hypothetical protein
VCDHVGTGIRKKTRRPGRFDKEGSLKSTTSTEFRVGEPVPGTEWIMRGILGQGGAAVVLEVSKGESLRAAMKVLHPPLERRDDFEARFLQEVEITARLRHANIVEVRDRGVLQNGSPFVLMERLTGRTLRAASQEQPASPESPLFPAQTVWRIVGEMAAGLSHAHDRSPPIVHRDIKPENVFLHRTAPLECQVKLLDFGLAQVLVDTAPSPENVVLGTPRYLAPEVLRREPISAKVDLYALALVAYELLTDAYPWPVDVKSKFAVAEARHYRPRAPSFRKSWIPKSVDDALIRALSENPDDRQSSVAEFYRELAELQVVDDGSANFYLGGPTVVMLETLAGGYETPVPHPGVPVQTQPPVPNAAAEDGPRIARSPVAEARDPVVGVHTGAQARPPAEEPPQRPAPSNVAHAEGRLAPRGPQGSDSPTSETGPAMRQAARRRRVAPTAVALSTAMIVATGAWGGWKAEHQARTSEVPPRVELPPALMLALAPAAVRVAAPDPTLAATAPGSAALDAGGPSANTPAARSAPPRAISAPHAAVPPRRKPSGPAPAPTNLDDILFGAEDLPPAAPMPPAAIPAPRAAAAPRGKPAAPPPAPTNIDDILFGAEDLPPAAPLPSSAPRSP